jgi:hypothetical protein
VRILTNDQALLAQDQKITLLGLGEEITVEENTPHIAKPSLLSGRFSVIVHILI